jgi:hypothetical protein
LSSGNSRRLPECWQRLRSYLAIKLLGVLPACRVWCPTADHAPDDSRGLLIGRRDRGGRTPRSARAVLEDGVREVATACVPEINVDEHVTLAGLVLERVGMISRGRASRASATRNGGAPTPSS